jgi:hypothetical protein
LENRILRRTIVYKREEVAGDLRILYDDERRNLYSSPAVIRMTKLRRVRLMGQATLGQNTDVPSHSFRLKLKMWV